MARDYRAFLDHFSESARGLGLSEGQAEDLLEQVAPPLLANAPPPAPEQAKPEASATDSGDEAVASSDQGEHTSEGAQSTAGDAPVPDEAAAAVSGAGPDQTGAASGLEADDAAGKTVPDAAASPAGIATSDDGSGDAVADAITSGDVPRPNGADRAHEERSEKPAS